MILRNLHQISDNATIDVHVQNGQVVASEHAATKYDIEVIFDDAIVFPGLINSHDHLDFNCFPQLGNRMYSSYVEWGQDIHSHNKQTINAVLKIPLALRVRWGEYKNLLAGVTTVVNHGTWLNAGNDLITVFQHCNMMHSVQLEKNWRWKLNRPFTKGWPFVVHIGEGSDEGSHLEIDELIRWNLWNRKIVGIHGIAMNERQAAHLKALVWCPDSNLFLTGRTAAVGLLKRNTQVLFGTDSTVSATWDIWEHLRIARKTKEASDKEILNMLTTQPANTWMLNCGSIEPGYDADIVVARKKKGLTGYDAFFAVQPEDILLILSKGNVKLVDETLLAQVASNSTLAESLSKISVGHSVKYVYGDLPALTTEIARHYPDAEFPVKKVK